MGKFKDWIVNWLTSMLAGFDGNVETAVRVLTEDIFTPANGMFQIAQDISNVIKPVALVIITILFLIEFLQITIKMDILKWEYALRVFAKFVLAKATIDVSVALMEAIYATASEWIVGSGSVGSSLGATVGLAIAPTLTNISWYEALGLVTTMMLPFLGVWLVGLMIVVMAYARTFELMIYIAVSPLPCAFLVSENIRMTKRFFLSFASVCLQGLFIIISIKLYERICTTAILSAITSSTNISDIAFNMLLGALVLMMAVTKSGTWAKAIMDAV